jgi:hypothetical protein
MAEARVLHSWANTFVRVLEDIAGGLQIQKTGGTFQAFAPINTGVTEVVTAERDPFEEMLGMCNNDPWWEDFPNWLNDYRSAIHERDLPPED